MRFIETRVFTATLTDQISDESYRTLQIALLLRPEQGVVIPGSGGLRKLRWAAPGRGKRGGLRLIYYWHPAEQALYLLFAYAKNEQGDLTTKQIKILAQFVEEEFG